MNLSPNTFIHDQLRFQPTMPHDSPILPDLSPVDGRDLQARFNGGALSSDGGVLLPREIERKMRLSDVLASCLADRRDPARTRHCFASMIRARVMAIACGYEDCDDMTLQLLDHFDPELSRRYPSGAPSPLPGCPPPGLPTWLSLGPAPDSLGHS